MRGWVGLFDTGFLPDFGLLLVGGALVLGARIAGIAVVSNYRPPVVRQPVKPWLSLRPSVPPRARLQLRPLDVPVSLPAWRSLPSILP